MPTPNPSEIASFTEPDTATSWAGHMADDGGATYGPEPLARLTITAEGLWLHGTRGSFRVPRSSIVRLTRGRLYPWFFSAVRIRHDVSGLSRELQFKPLRLKPSELLKRLRALGIGAERR